MRKLYREFFYIPKYGKIREKVMLTRVVSTVAIIVFCLAAMGITAYAYFSYDITSARNKIQAANFETNVNIQITDENGESVEVITSNYKSHVATLKANTKYFITLKPTQKSTATTGFVIVTAEGCEDRYHTQQLGKDGSGNTDTVTFYLVLGADTKVTFLAHWGTSSYYGYNSDSDQYIKQGETVQIPVNGLTATDNNGEDNSTETKDPETTTPTEIVHTVASGESLYKIAELYNTTVARIVAHNNIENANSIQVGQIIKIPPTEWVMPENTTPKPTEPVETTPPTTETTKPVETTPPATSEPAGTEEPSATESTTPATTLDPTESIATTEPQSEETTDATTTEANS